MSNAAVGAEAAAPDDQLSYQEHNSEGNFSMDLRNFSGEHIRQITGSESLNEHHTPLPPLMRASSASSLESNGYRRRRREGKTREEPRYPSNLTSRSEGNLAASPDVGRDLEDLSDNETLEGRRVRMKYARRPEEHRSPSSGQASLNPEERARRKSAYEAWNANRSTGSINLSGESSNRNNGPTSRNPSQGGSNRGLEPWESTGSRTRAESSQTSSSGMYSVGQRATPNVRGHSNSGSGRPGALPSSFPTSSRQDQEIQLRRNVAPSRLNETPNSADRRIRARSSFNGPNDEYSTPGRDLPLPSRPGPTEVRPLRADIVLPRWQPDAEVTFCPICKTQFSFFIRKHHCRKCGRVVCNSCSPHRITIPYQFIVQPPSDPAAAASSLVRPTLDPARAESSLEFASLGGGERVRLCNPCVPDPNIAPPQTPQFEHQRRPTPSHTRSASLASPNFDGHQGPRTSQGEANRPSFEYLLSSFQRRPREPSILGGNPPSRVPSASHSQSHTGSLGSHSPAGDSQGFRSRSSTTTGDYSGSQRSQNPTLQPHYRSLIPRDEQYQSRPLPRPPRLNEEDECPVCHQELPSSALPNAEDLRAAHINNCIESAFGGTTTSPPVPPTSSTRPTIPSSSRPPAPIPNTPEARTAAREQAHASIVLGHSAPPTHRRTGVFPYKATEKDCIDDAECTICLEEFEVNEDMGRLECFCRFHLKCIRGWFELHPGQCPVHQHDGGY